MNEFAWLSRTELIVGREGLEKLATKHVLVVGLGGVGSFAAEFIARSGIGADDDCGWGHGRHFQCQPAASSYAAQCRTAQGRLDGGALIGHQPEAQVTGDQEIFRAFRNYGLAGRE